MDRVSTGRLRAVLFDLDGTLADTERDGHRVAFNRAFERAGLPDRWDEALYGELLWVARGRNRLEHYFTHHRPVPQAERAPLVRRLVALKRQAFLEIVAEGGIAPRPGAARLIGELQRAGIATAVVTGGERHWVEPLLVRLFGSQVAAGFRAIVTGDDVGRPKPHPEGYLEALARLGCPAGTAIAVEDAEIGLRSAKAAGLACVVVTNGYTVGHDLRAADLVVDGFGAPAEPCTVSWNPHGLAVEGALSVPLLRTLRCAASADQGRAGSGRRDALPPSRSHPLPRGGAGGSTAPPARR